MQPHSIQQQHQYFIQPISQHLIMPYLMQPPSSTQYTQKNIILVDGSMFNNLNGNHGCKIEEQDKDSYEPKFKTSKIEQQPGVTSHKVIAITKVVRVTKTIYKYRIPVQKPAKQTENQPSLTLEQTRAIRPTLYKLLRTLKNPESIQKIQQSLKYFDQLELMAAAKKLQEKNNFQGGEDKTMLKSNLAIMHNFIKSLKPEKNEKTNLMFFDPREELKKMVQETQAQVSMNEAKSRIYSASF